MQQISFDFCLLQNKRFKKLLTNFKRSDTDYLSFMMCFNILIFCHIQLNKHFIKIIIMCMNNEKNRHKNDFSLKKNKLNELRRITKNSKENFLPCIWMKMSNVNKNAWQSHVWVVFRWTLDDYNVNSLFSNLKFTHTPRHCIFFSQFLLLHFHRNLLQHDKIEGGGRGWR